MLPTGVSRGTLPYVFGLALVLLVGCAGGGSRVTAPHVAPSAVAPNAVAVGGDSPEEFRHNVDAARSAGKTVRIVGVDSATGIDIYSPYAQIVRSRAALLVRAYGRVHVYRIAGTKVTYPDRTLVAIEALPAVDTPTIDAAMTSGASLGVPIDRRRLLCAHCDFVLIRAAASAQSSTLWADAKDPWQKTVDYEFWSPGSDAGPKRGASFVTQCGIEYGGCCPTYQPPLVVCIGYYPGSGFSFGGGYGGGYNCGGLPCSYYFERDRFNKTAEIGCTTLHGRWLSTSRGDFWCRHKGVDENATIIDPSGCAYIVSLPDDIKPPIKVFQSDFMIDEGSLGGTTTSQGVKMYIAVNQYGVSQCYWFGAGPKPAQ